MAASTTYANPYTVRTNNFNNASVNKNDPICEYSEY